MILVGINVFFFSFLICSTIPSSVRYHRLPTEVPSWRFRYALLEVLFWNAKLFVEGVDEDETLDEGVVAADLVVLGATETSAKLEVLDATLLLGFLLDEDLLTPGKVPGRVEEG